MAAGTRWKFTINRIASKRFIRLAPGLATFDQKRTAYKIPCYNFIIFEYKMAADGHFKFDSWTISGFFHWSSPQATIVDRFGRVIRQNACLDASRCLFGFTKIQSSVFTPQIPKNAIFGTSNAFPMENKNLNNFSIADHRTVKLHKFNPLHILNNNPLSENWISKSKMADGAILNF
jgi:hypothetical protein